MTVLDEIAIASYLFPCWLVGYEKYSLQQTSLTDQRARETFLADVQAKKKIFF